MTYELTKEVKNTVLCINRMFSDVTALTKCNGMTDVIM